MSERPASLTFRGFLRGVVSDSVAGPVDRRTDRVRDAAMTVAEITGRTDGEAMSWVLERRPTWLAEDRISQAEYDAVTDEAAAEIERS